MILPLNPQTFLAAKISGSTVTNAIIAYIHGVIFAYLFIIIAIYIYIYIYIYVIHTSYII